VTKDKYYEYLNTLKIIDWSNTESALEIENDECISGVCPVK
jgi:hypothetical protein